MSYVGSIPMSGTGVARLSGQANATTPIKTTKQPNSIITAALADGRVSAQELIEARRHNLDGDLIAFEEKAQKYITKNEGAIRADFDNFVAAGYLPQDVTGEQLEAYYQEWIKAVDEGYRKSMLEDMGVVDKNAADKQNQEIIKAALADGKVTFEELVKAKKNNADISDLINFETNAKDFINNNKGAIREDFNNLLTEGYLPTEVYNNADLEEAYYQEFIKAVDEGHRKAILEDAGLVDKNAAAKQNQEFIKAALADGKVTFQELVEAIKNNFDTDKLTTFENDAQDYITENEDKIRKDFDNFVLHLEKDQESLSEEEEEKLYSEWLKATDEGNRKKMLETYLEE